MLPDEKVYCHLSGFDPKAGKFRARCRDILSKCDCPKYVRVLGKDPNVEDATIDHWGCADAMGHLLQIEGSRQTFHVSAELAELRKEMDVRDRNHEVVIASLGQQLQRQHEETQRAMQLVAGVAKAMIELPGLNPSPERALEHHKD